MRGAIAVVGVLLRVTVHELRVSDTWLAIGGILGLGLLFSSALGPLSTWRSAFNADGTWDVWRLVFLMPQSTALGIALATMTPQLAGVRRIPVLSTSLVVMLLMMMTVGWVIPESNQAFRRHVAAGSGRSEPARGLAERPVPELIEAAQYKGVAAEAARRRLAQLGWLVVLPPALLLLGVQARRFTRGRRWRFGAGALAWSTLVAAYGLGAMASEAMRWAVLSNAYGVGAWIPVLGLWVALAFVVVATLVLARLATRRELQHAAG